MKMHSMFQWNFQFYSVGIGRTSADKSKGIKSKECYRKAVKDFSIEIRERNFTHRGKHEARKQLIQAKM